MHSRHVPLECKINQLPVGLGYLPYRPRRGKRKHFLRGVLWVLHILEKPESKRKHGTFSLGRNLLFKIHV